MRTFAEDLAEGAPAGLAGEQAQQVAGDVLEEHAAFQLRFDIRPIRPQQFSAQAQFAAAPDATELLSFAST